MIGFPPCKINLGLQVIRRRPDGYHDLDTCFYPVPFCDVLEVLPAETFSFRQTGLTLPGNVHENLCVKAWQFMHRQFGTPAVQVYLHKCIPPGAGLGGGSADAAWMLRLLQQLFHKEIPQNQLLAVAGSLGSDCPFFLYDAPMLGSGIGDVLRPAGVSLKGYSLVLLKPDVHMSTAEAYQHVVPAENRPPVYEILRTDIRQWKTLLVNDFEASVMRKYPVIQELKNALYGAGAVYASMSGSGSAVYGIFSRPVSVPQGLNGYLIWQGEL
ncbi:MAG: 4-diphosphocytidyl-2-C-methyl-D-erythritol kinase [Cyclobacteriaceae bacterium]|nr:MAG: 4-diphosphocytidyl-2-C-methyl-D-erythritol kinase [Cyclobacteriaceae bacterium]